MSTTEEISVYKDPNNAYQSPTLGRRTIGYCYDFPQKASKKDKKWSISSIFRRKKKEESDSTSEEESSKKGFLNRSRKKKSEGKKKKHVKTLGTFDHVVMPPCPRNSLFLGNNFEDGGVLSDPTGGFSAYNSRPFLVHAKETITDLNQSRSSLGSGSGNNYNKKSKKELVKARAEARRTSSRNGSSSDEDSQRSNSSMLVRSEENLKLRDAPTSRRSRAARTERYLKRNSRDGENPHNYLRLSKSDAENSTSNWKLSDDSNRSPSRSPLVPAGTSNINTSASLSSQNTIFSGLSTIPPSHAACNRFRVSNSTSNPTYKQSAQSMNEYNNSIKKTIDVGSFSPDQRSVSCDANIHKSPSTELTEAVLSIQLPIIRANNRGYRNLSLIDPAHFNRIKQPPPPPPRDPNRTIGMHYFEGGRPSSYYFDSSGQFRTKSFNALSSHQAVPQTKKNNSFNLNHPNFRSTSEDHLSQVQPIVQLAARPSSTTPDSGVPQRFISRRPAGSVAGNEEINYLADRQPRSRKPLFVQYGTKSLDNSVSAKTELSGSQKALDFWKQIDKQNLGTEKPAIIKTRPNSPKIFTSHTRLQTQVFLPSVLQNDFDSSNHVTDNRMSSPFKPMTPTTLTRTEPPKDENAEKEDIKRKSSNLEEALDELEAIYNSLRLGDDDLLERAEQRERESQAKRCQDSLNSHPNYSARGALSDSTFSYEPFDSVDSPRRKRMLRKHRTVDIKHDDMAFRKLNKERANTISDPHSVISRVSYLLASPVHGNNNEEEQTNNKTNEPDITHDDVVYRNFKHANNSLKVTEPQPPFGIPIGPITPAAKSDYLHAKPENIFKPIFKHKKIPDIVKDDLAFRNLRKDGNKSTALPPLSTEDYKNNNAESLNYLRKKRAQRSLSANIGNLIQTENNNNNNTRKNDEDVEKDFKTLTDIADAMEIARRVLKTKESRISATKKAFMSDTDTQYMDNPEHVNGIRRERRDFLNGLKAKTLDSYRNGKPSSPRLSDNLLLAKPPRVTPETRKSSKESIPIAISSLEDRKSIKSESTSSSLEDLLNALAEEAKETTEKITNELKLLADQNQKKTIIKTEEEQKNKELYKKLSEIDAVSEHAKLCEKLLENVVDSSEFISSAKDPDEVVEQINDEKAAGESANIVLTRIDSKEDNNREDTSDHDYENLISDKELRVEEVNVNKVDDFQEKEQTCRSPFEEHKQELIANFQELKENPENVDTHPKIQYTEDISNIDVSCGKIQSIYDHENEEEDDKEKGVTGEEACGPLFRIVALPSKECAFTINANPLDNEQMFTSNCDLVLRKPNLFLLHDDSANSSGFHSNCSCDGDKPEFHNENFGSCNNLDSLESLKSPQLVMQMANKVPVRDNTEEIVSQCSLSVPRSSRLVLEASQDLSKPNSNPENGNIRDHKHSCSSRHCVEKTIDVAKPSVSWYRDPANNAFACSYGIACAHQLANLDLFAILSILLAVISFITTLFL